MARRRLPIIVALLGALACVVLGIAIALQGGTTAGGRDHIRAVLEGEPIPAQDVGRYHCHDRDYPLIRCFRTAAARDADIGMDGGGR